jgi:predicted MFS family arabinose efflux permease
MLRVFGAMATCETSDSGLERTPSDRTFVLLAAAITGVVASNLFAPQILVGPIGSSLGMTEQQAGIISSITFLGYASGLFLLVPLTDILENKGSFFSR